ESVASIQQLIAPGEHGFDSARAERVIHARGDIDGGFVVDEAQLGALTRRLAFVRHHLSQLGNRSRAGPSRIVDLSVDDDGSLSRRGVSYRARIVLGSGCLLSCRRWCEENCENDE